MDRRPPDSHQADLYFFGGTLMHDAGRLLLPGSVVRKRCKGKARRMAAISLVERSAAGRRCYFMPGGEKVIARGRVKSRAFWPLTPPADSSIPVPASVAEYYRRLQDAT